MNRQKITVAVAFARDSSHYPNIKTQNLVERDAIYWNCICVALASAKYLGGDCVTPLLISNEERPEEYQEFFDWHAIGFQKLAFSHQPPDGFATSFVGSLFTLDAIAWFGACASEKDKILLIDPDCLVNAPLERLAVYLDHVQALVYSMAYPRNQVINGQSLDGIDEWMQQRLPTLERWDLRWLGGEFLGLTGAACRILTPVISQVWQANLAAFSEGKPFLKTEEHILSAAFAGTRPSRREAGGQLVQRLWTTRGYHNLSSSALDLPIWHMPAEKQRGFTALYEGLSQCTDPESARQFLCDRRMLQRLFGFQGRVGLRLLSLVVRTVRLAKDILLGRVANFEGQA